MEKKQFRHRFPLEQGETVVLRNTRGGLAAEAWDRPEVAVEGETFTNAPGKRAAERLLDSLRFDAERRDHGVFIRGWIRPNLWTRVLGPFADWGIALRLTVPRETRLDAYLVNHGARLSSVAGDVRIRSVNGDVEVEGAGPRLDAGTTNGTVSARITHLERDGEIVLRSVNGRVALLLGRDAHPELEARSRNGTVEIDPAICRRLREREGRGAVRLSSVNGSVEVTPC